VLRTPLDALPDLSDVQVIIRTTYPGQAPRIVENQVTYPLTTTMLSVPGAKTVRGYSFFGDSFVYVLFRRRHRSVLGALARAGVPEPGAVTPAARPRPRWGRMPPAWAGSTSTRWWTAAAHMDASQLRALQDWFLKYELKTVPNVAEVASVGGMVRQYQVVLDPDKLAAYGIPHTQSGRRHPKGQPGSRRLGAGAGRGRIHGARLGLPAIAGRLPQVPLMTTDAGVSVRLGDVARIQVGPEMRRGIGELDGEGEAAGGVIVMRSGKNALETIAAVKAKLKRCRPACPRAWRSCRPTTAPA
jgi:Cu(I)/Ag(I) efflux system membrane protein CusA/SilA